MKLLDLFFAARPMLLLPVWSILIVSHYFIPHEFSIFNDYNLILAYSFVFMGAYYINQVFDYETDKVNNKLGFLQKGIISKREMTIAYLLISIAGIVLGFLYSSFVGKLILAIFVIGLIYSAPPLKLKNRAISGLLANSISYGLLVVLPVTQHTGHFQSYLYSGLFIYFICAVNAVFLLTIIPDKEGDIASGKKTLVAYFPDSAVITFAIINLLVSCLMSFSPSRYLLLLIAIVSIIALLIAVILKSDKSILFACKLPILLLSILAGYYYWPYLIFLIALLVLTRIYYKQRFNINYPEIN